MNSDHCAACRRGIDAYQETFWRLSRPGDKGRLVCNQCVDNLDQNETLEAENRRLRMQTAYELNLTPDGFDRRLDRRLDEPTSWETGEVPS